MSYLPRHVLVPAVPRHVGFLTFNRRLLAMGAVVACGSLTGIYAMPASAEVVHEEVFVAQLQTFTATSVAAATPVVRDPFVVTEYSLVQWPVPSTTTMSSDFGFRSCAGCSSDHKGIDLNPGSGYPVQAIADGVVVEAVTGGGGLGVYLVIEHVINGQTVRSLYGHLVSGSMTATVGQTVSRGEQIGQVGSTGQSTGAHLHFEIIVDTIQIDPLPWLLANANS